MIVFFEVIMMRAHVRPFFHVLTISANGADLMMPDTYIHMPC